MPNSLTVSRHTGGDILWHQLLSCSVSSVLIWRDDKHDFQLRQDWKASIDWKQADGRGIVSVMPGLPPFP